MKIAVLTDGIHPYVIGGMQKHSYYLVRELARNRHFVYLFHCNASSYDANKLEFFSEEERKYIKSHLIPFPHKKYFPLHYIYESHQYSEAIYQELQPLLPEVDFIFAQGFCAWSLLKHKNKTQRPPVVVHFHGLEMFQNIPSFKSKLSRYFLQTAVKANLQKADYTISFGGKITGILNRIVKADEIWEIPGGIEKKWLVEAAQPVSDKVRFAFVGRYERRKGIPELNEAIIRLIQHNNFSVEFIGEIPAEHKLSYPAVHYHGKLSSENEVKHILSGCDVLVCPSYAEGLPNVIMEAMACGLAVIATDVGAVSKLVSNDNGWLISSPKASDIACAMQAAMNDELLQQKKAISLKKVRQGFLIETVTSMLIDKMEACLKNV